MMSGLTEARLFLAIGWIVVVAGFAMISYPAAIIVGGTLFLLYAFFVVDVDRKAKPRKGKSDSNVYITTPRG